MSHRADPRVVPLADRHYNRQKVGAPQFAPPGRCMVLTTPQADAFWITSWPYAQFVKHAWAGAWICSAFRREAGPPASDMILDAVAATRAFYRDPPPLGMVTFIDRAQVRPVVVRGVKTWGRTWRFAGFRECGETKGGLLAMQLLPADMPPPAPAIGASLSLFGAAA